MRYRIAAAAFVLMAAFALMTSSSIAQTGSTTPAPPDTVAVPDSVAAPAAPAPAAATPAPAAAAPPAQTAPPPATAPAAQTTPPPATAPAAQTAPPPAKTEPSGPFDRGRTRASFTAGWGRSFGDDYLLVGVGLGRFIKTGLAVGLNFESWIGSDPGVNKLTPRVDYILTRMVRLTPYVGAFYTRSFIQDYDDLSSLGGRVGVYRGRGRASYGVGGVYENYLDCDESTYGDCSSWYPEVFVSTTF